MATTPSIPGAGSQRLTTLVFFNGQNPNGTWQLFIQDDTGGDTGSLAGGWALEVTAQVERKEKKHHHKKH